MTVDEANSFFTESVKHLTNNGYTLQVRQLLVNGAHAEMAVTVVPVTTPPLATPVEVEPVEVIN